MKNNRGFSLLEILIVIMILGILIAVALPVYSRAIEKGRMVEAIQNLGALRNSEIKYYMQYGRTTACYLELDWADPVNAPEGMGVKRFGGYSIRFWGSPDTPLTALGYLCNRNTVDLPPGVSTYVVSMSANGLVENPY